MTAHLHGLGDFFSDISADKLSATGGVYYIRGGFKNIENLKPAGRTRPCSIISSATTIIRAIPTRQSPKRWWRAR